MRTVEFGRYGLMSSAALLEGRLFVAADVSNERMALMEFDRETLQPLSATVAADWFGAMVPVDDELWVNGEQGLHRFEPAP